MVNVKKFSEFNDAGDLENNNTTVGLEGGINSRFDNPWTFLPPGTTGDRPAIFPDMYYRLRLNTQTQLYEYYDPINATWTSLQNDISEVLGIIGTENQVLVNGTFGTIENGIITLTLPQDIAPANSPQFNNLQLDGGHIFDASGNISVRFQSNLNADNYINLINNVSGQVPAISVDGPDVDIGVLIVGKGLGGIGFATRNIDSPFNFYSGTNAQHRTNFVMANTATIRDVTWQDSDGTVAWLTDIPAGSPSALTRVDDTNITITLGGTPSTALLQAVSLTMGWTGQLGLTRGGTAASLTASNGGIIYSTASALAILAGTATAGQMLQSGANTTPAWSTTTYPATNVINTIMYASSTNVLGSISAVNNAVLVSSSGGVPSMSTTLPSGIAATNMNLTTPTLGVASATSINFGGGALDTFVPNTTWTPVFTFATAGDLSVSYSTQVGWYSTIGGMTFMNFILQCTPTFTTSSGEFRITGQPITASFRGSCGSIYTGLVTFTATYTQAIVLAQSGTNYLTIQQSGSNAVLSSMTTTNFTSGVGIVIAGSVAVFRS